MASEMLTWKDDFGITDDGSLVEAALINPGGAFRLRRPQTSGIWKPRKVWLEEYRGLPYLRYEVPDFYHVTGVLDWGNLAARFDAENFEYFLSMASPQTWGWEKVDQTKGLLESFIRLDSPDKICKFAAKWGPLWMSVDTETSDIGFWSPIADLYTQNRWRPIEPISFWLTCVTEIRACLEIMAILQNPPPKRVPGTLINRCRWLGDQDTNLPWGFWNDTSWPMLIPDERYVDPTLASEILHIAITRRIQGDPETCRLDLTRQSLQPYIDPGFGFIRTVWYMVAQAAGRVRGVYTCSACGTPFVRPFGVRAPRTSQRYYCGVCGQGDRAAKRISADRKRARLRQLISFVTQQLNASATNWSEILTKWNAQYPEWAYPNQDDLVDALKRKTKSYGIPLGSLSTQLGGTE